jgi:hypothetical protein
MKKNSNFNQHLIHFYDKPDQLDEKKKHARKKEDIFNRRKKRRPQKETLFLITNKPAQELTSPTNNVIQKIHHHKNFTINKRCSTNNCHRHQDNFISISAKLQLNKLQQSSNITPFTEVFLITNDHHQAYQEKHH